MKLIPKLLAFIFLLLIFTVPPTASVAAQDGSMPPMPEGMEPGYIHGRVLDALGEPVAGVEVVAYTYAMGDVLGWAQEHVCRQGDILTPGMCRGVTDAEGRFVVAVPFVGVGYQVGFRYGVPYTVKWAYAIAGQDVMVELTAKRRGTQPPIRGRLSHEDGSPAAGAVVSLVGAYRNQRWEVVTDADGRFVFAQMRSSYLGRPMLMAELDGLHVPLDPFYASDEPRDIQFRQPAAMVGVVRDANTGASIAGATVVAQSTRMCTLRWTATTDTDGWFQILDMPPGEYTYRAVCGSHTDQPARGDDWFSRIVELPAGGVIEVTGFEMLPRAVLRGRVEDQDGGPVAGALVGCPTHRGDGSEAIDTVYTDAQGRFELRPGIFGRPIQSLEAFHPLAGGVTVEVAPLAAGEVRDGIELVTQGTVRVRGTLTDREGRPLAAVGCWCRSDYSPSVSTDAQGRFDLGRVRLVEDEAGGVDADKIVVGFNPPDAEIRSAMDDDGYERQHEIESTDETYYAPGVWVGAIVDGGEVVVEAQLRRTDFLTFTGTVTDAAGEPVYGARVYLLPGRVSGEDEEVNKQIGAYIDGIDRHERERREGGGEPRFSWPETTIAPVRRSASDKDGTWTMQCLRYQCEDVPFVHGSPPAEAPEQVWVTLLIVWGDGDYELRDSLLLLPEKTEYELPVQLPLDTPDVELQP